MLLFLAIGAGLASVYLIAQAVRPLLESTVVTAADWERVEDESADLLARRDRLVDELRDLEFEAALNKVDANDFAALRARYESEAVALVRTLDERAAQFGDRISAAVEARLNPEQAPAADEAPPAPVRLGKKPDVPATPRIDEPEAGGLACGECGAGVVADDAFCDACGAPQRRACADCGTENRRTARFCRSCGTGLQEGAA